MSTKKILLSLVIIIPLLMFSSASAQIAMLDDKIPNENLSGKQTMEPEIAALMQNNTMKQNLTVNECPDYDKDGLCGSGAPIEGLMCTDMNHDLHCDWFRPVKAEPVNTTKPIVDVSHLKGMTVKTCPTEAELRPPGVWEEMCEWYANGTIAFTPIVQAPTPTPTPTPMAIAPIVQESKLVCQSNDDFCTPGCELADMQCIDEENDDNKNGVKDSEEEEAEEESNDRESNNNNNNGNEDIVYCEGQRVPEGEDSCYDQYDFEEGDGTGCDRNDEYCNEEDECGRPDIDCIDDTKERDDE